MEISKELVLLYFNNQCSAVQERLVAQWLAASEVNTKQAMRWIDELTDEEEKLFLKMVLSSKDVWKETVAKIEESTPATIVTQGRKPGKIKIILSYLVHHAYRNAAVLAGILMLGFAYYVYQKSRFVDISTKIGEVRRIILADGSEVTLMGDSHIRYYYNQGENDRKIWLQGAAYFKVKTLNNQAKLMVFLPDKKIIKASNARIDISAIGAAWSVLLHAGEAQLQFVKKGEIQRMELKPGIPVETQDQQRFDK